MKNPLLIPLLLLFSLTTGFTQAQQAPMRISGTVYDTSGVVPLKNAVVTAVRVRDSLLLSFTRTDEKGSFLLTGFPIDTFTMMVSHKGYDDKIIYFIGNAENRETNIPSIRMPGMTKELAEVTVYANKNPIYYKGDTLVYVADSFKVAKNAVVEDLLKKLPGMKVDKNGKITSQGKEIKKVLVDGDEFFGTDPTIATRNLGANGVESVQVYEKKNDLAKDGEEQTIQVLDLKLKEDAKKGYFGKISGATDFGLFEDRAFYETEFLLNKFNKKQKISVFALGSNTPKSSLGFGDMAKFGLDNELNNSGMSMWDQSGGNSTNGVPQTFKAGVYFQDKIGKRGELGFNYTYYNMKLNASSNSRSQYFLTDTTYYTRDTTGNTSADQSHRFNLTYELNIDSLTYLKVIPNLEIDLGNSDKQNITAFLNKSNQQSLKTGVQNTNDSKGLSSNSELYLLRKFKRPKRELELKYNLVASDNKTNGKLNSISDYGDSLKLIDQAKINNNSATSHYTTITYTEPLTKRIKLQTDYMFEYGFSTQNKETFNNTNGAYTQRVDYLSNNFENTRKQHRVSTELIYENRKHTARIGIGGRNIAIDNTNLITGKIIQQNITNFLPRASYNYKPNMTSRLGVSYRTSSSQPSINDLQPVPDNTNPNRTRKGNQNLQPNYVHSLNANYNTWNALSGRYIWSGINASLTNNAFADSTSYNNFGQTESKTVNVNGNINTNLYAGTGFSIWKKRIEIMPNFDFSYNRYTNLINSQQNITQNTTVGGGINLRFTDTASIVEINFEPFFNYTYPVSSLSTVSNKPYTSQTYTTSVDWKINKRFRFKTDINYTANQNLAPGYNLNIFIWNAEISRSFLKTENLIVSLMGNDIFNQNKNIQRQVSGNIITDNNTKLISRYFLLKVIFKFNNNKTKEDEFSGWN